MGWMIWGQEFSVNIHLIFCKYSAEWARTPEPKHSSIYSWTTCVWCLISGFRRELDENCALLGHYTANSGDFLPVYSNIYPTRCNVTQFIMSGNCSTCFGWYPNLSSAVIYYRSIPIHIEEDATLHSLLYLGTALHVSGGTPTYHQR